MNEPSSIKVDKALIIVSKAPPVGNHRTRLALAFAGGALVAGIGLHIYHEREVTDVQRALDEQFNKDFDRISIERYWNNARNSLFNFLKIRIKSIDRQNLSLSGADDLVSQINLPNSCNTTQIDPVECYYGARTALEELKHLKEFINDILSDSPRVPPREEEQLLGIKNQASIYIERLEPLLDDLFQHMPEYLRTQQSPPRRPTRTPNELVPRRPNANLDCSNGCVYYIGH